MVTGPSEDSLKDSDKSLNTLVFNTIKSSTVEKSMEKTEKNGSMKSSLNFKRKTQPSLSHTFSMVIKQSPKVTHAAFTYAIKPTEKTFWVEMPTSKLPCTQLWASLRICIQTTSPTFTEIMERELSMKP